MARVETVRKQEGETRQKVFSEETGRKSSRLSDRLSLTPFACRKDLFVCVSVCVCQCSVGQKADDERESGRE